MTSQEIFEKYLNFYKSKKHIQIPNVSLIPENDPTLLYVNSGMFPLVPYFLGEEHPEGKRLVNIQRCLRINEDIENVGETNRHTTFFHMLGNWSLGDYFKKEQIPWVYEFFIEILGLDPKRIYATVFEGDESAPKDIESIEILTEIFKKYGIDPKINKRIFAYSKKDNWWQRGEAVGELGGPDSEIFYYIGKNGDGLGKNPADHQDSFLEIGNSVFCQYRFTDIHKWEEISQKNVDFGGGLERIALVVQGKTDIFETDNFWPIILKIEEITGKKYKENEIVTKAMRVIADHMRASTMMVYDGVIPSNKEQGYLLRRLLRRMTRYSRNLGMEKGMSIKLVDPLVENLKWLYPDLPEKTKQISDVFQEEEEKFFKTLLAAEPKVKEALGNFVGDEKDLAKKAFDIYQSLGYPLEMFLDEITEKSKETGNETKFDIAKIKNAFNNLFEEHQKGSRQGSEAKFKGGLSDSSKNTVAYHTVTHILHQALRNTLGTEIQQAGSNITGDRLRFDFNYPDKISESDLAKITDEVNKIIEQKLPVNSIVLPKNEAEKTGALHFFKDKYGENIKIYFIGKDLKTAYSKEYCGGPHIKNTSELGKIEIFKQESVGKGVRRIYAKFSSK